MGKKSRQRHRDESASSGSSSVDAPVGPRQPCPCGSGRRYRHCHGADGGASPYVRRPFEGLTAEADVVALREFVPAATARVRLREGAGDRDVLLCSLLPGASPALVRADGTIWLGLQVQHAYGDPSRDLAAVLTAALDAEPDSIVGLGEDPGPGPRLQDLLVDEPLEIEVHDGFDYWVADVEDPDGSVASVLQQANEAAAPTARVEGVEAAYWTSMGGREYLRWVQTADEDAVLDAVARLHASGADSLVEGDRMIGMFRAHGLAVPVWDLPRGTGPDALVAPLAELAGRLRSALEDTTPLTSEERAARAGLASRQLTIR